MGAGNGVCSTQPLGDPELGQSCVGDEAGSGLGYSAGGVWGEGGPLGQGFPWVWLWTLGGRIPGLGRGPGCCFCPKARRGRGELPLCPQPGLWGGRGTPAWQGSRRSCVRPWPGLTTCPLAGRFGGAGARRLGSSQTPPFCDPTLLLVPGLLPQLRAVDFQPARGHGGCLCFPSLSCSPGRAGRSRACSPGSRRAEWTQRSPAQQGAAVRSELLLLEGSPSPVR